MSRMMIGRDGASGVVWLRAAFVPSSTRAKKMERQIPPRTCFKDCRSVRLCLVFGQRQWRFRDLDLPEDKVLPVGVHFDPRAL